MRLPADAAGQGLEAAVGLKHPRRRDRVLLYSRVRQRLSARFWAPLHNLFAVFL